MSIEQLRLEEEARIKKEEDDRIRSEIRHKNLTAEEGSLRLER